MFTAHFSERNAYIKDRFWGACKANNLFVFLSMVLNTKINTTVGISFIFIVLHSMSFFQNNSVSTGVDKTDGF